MCIPQNMKLNNQEFIRLPMSYYEALNFELRMPILSFYLVTNFCGIENGRTLLRYEASTLIFTTHLAYVSYYKCKSYLITAIYVGHYKLMNQTSVTLAMIIS